jgi:hypothetical protein
VTGHAAWFRSSVFAATMAVATLAVAAFAPPSVGSAAPDQPTGRSAASHGAWVDVGPMSSPHENATSIRLRSGRVLVMGGYASYDCCCVRTVDLFKPRTGEWERRASMPRRRCSPAVLLPNGQVLVAGGQGVNPNNWVVRPVASALLYHPRSDRWSYTGTMHHRGAGAGVVLADGRVLMTSQDGGAWAELYDPATKVWRTTVPPTNAHSTLVRLRNGQVLAVGSSGTRAQACAERYLPRQGAWRSTRGYTWRCPFRLRAALLPDGQVMVQSGHRQVRIYRPTTNRWRSLPPLPLGTGSNAPLPQAVVTISGQPMVLASRPGCLPSKQQPTAVGPRTVGIRWQPRRHAWARWTTLPDGGLEISATELRDGSVLLAGAIQWHYCELSGDHTPSDLAYRYFPGR